MKDVMNIRWTAFILLLWGLLAACRKDSSTSKSEDEVAPLDPRLLEPLPQAQQNLMGTGAADSMDIEDEFAEPLPPPSQDSPYKSSPPQPPKDKKD